MNCYWEKGMLLIRGEKKPPVWCMDFDVGNPDYEPPDILKPYFTRNIDNIRIHRLSGNGIVPEEVLTSISENIGNRVFCHLDAGNGYSYVWPTDNDNKNGHSVISLTGEVIHHFEYDR